MNKIIIIIAVLILVGGGYFFLRGGNKPTQEGETQTPSLGVPAPGQEGVQEAVVLPGGDEIEEIRMVSGNLFFNPGDLTLTKDKPVRIVFENIGVHTFTIDELGVNVPLRGSSGVAEFTPTQSGIFEYYCAVPGHREGGMFGSLQVVEQE